MKELSRARFGPDAATTTLLVKSDGKELQMRSWHELIEADGGTVRGIGVVSDKRPRFHVLREEPEDYLFYRFVWAEVRGRALSLIPVEGRTSARRSLPRRGRGHVAGDPRVRASSESLE